MVLQVLTSVAYEIVQASWRISTLAVPAFLAARIPLAYLRNELKDLETELLRESKPFVAVLVLAGSLSVVTGTEFPRFELIGDLITVIYFGFLFWKF